MIIIICFMAKARERQDSGQPRNCQISRISALKFDNQTNGYIFCGKKKILSMILTFLKYLVCLLHPVANENLWHCCCFIWILLFFLITNTQEKPYPKPINSFRWLIVCLRVRRGNFVQRTALSTPALILFHFIPSVPSEETAHDYCFKPITSLYH